MRPPLRLIGLFLALLITWSSLAPAVASAQSGKGEDVIDRMKRSTAFIVTMVERQGRMMARRGSGSLIIKDARRNIVLTNYHVVLKSSEAYVMFPVRKPNGDLIAEPESYLRSLKDPAVSFPGKVIITWPEKDLALIDLGPIRLPNHLRPLPLAEKSPRQAAVVHTMGNPAASGMWSYTKGEVRTVFDKSSSFALDGETLRVNARVIDTSNPINRGDSGGPLVNDRFEQVGVAQSINLEAQSVSTFIAVEEIWALLDKAKLRTIAQQITRNHAAALARGIKGGGLDEDETSTATSATEEGSAEKKTASKGAGEATPPEDPKAKAERLAAAKLKQAKLFQTAGQAANAVETLDEILEKFPDTKAAAEAKELRGKIKR